jgi:hypothetical protein
VRRALQAVLVVVAVLIPGWAASSAALPYNLVLSPKPSPSSSTGMVIGQFGGVPVTGAYSGDASSGSLILNVKGMAFVVGRYSCSNFGCVLTGLVSGKVVTAMAMTSLGGVGQAGSSAFPNREAWVSTVTDWATTHLGRDQVTGIASAASGVEMRQTLGEQGRGNGNGNETGEHGGMESGNGGMGMH